MHVTFILTHCNLPWILHYVKGVASSFRVSTRWSCVWTQC